MNDPTKTTETIRVVVRAEQSGTHVKLMFFASPDGRARAMLGSLTCRVAEADAILRLMTTAADEVNGVEVDVETPDGEDLDDVLDVLDSWRPPMSSMGREIFEAFAPGQPGALGQAVAAADGPGLRSLDRGQLFDVALDRGDLLGQTADALTGAIEILEAMAAGAGVDVDENHPALNLARGVLDAILDHQTATQ